MHKVEEDASVVLFAAKEALARGNINFIRYELNELLQLFRINLDPACADYRKVALAVIRADVRALEDVLARNRVNRLTVRSCPSPAAQPPCRAAACEPPTMAGTKWKLVQSRREWSSLAGLTASWSCTVIWMWSGSTGGMSASFVKRRSLFQSVGPASSEKLLCQSL